jgi:AbrB family looped-hinge helix DNA binding protein
MSQKKEDICDPQMRMFWSVTVGSKWQIVIPKEVRELLNIQEWDTLMVVTKHDIAVGMIKSDNIPKMMEYMQSEINH